jgi:hypothetical protein
MPINSYETETMPEEEEEEEEEKYQNAYRLLMMPVSFLGRQTSNTL